MEHEASVFALAKLDGGLLASGTGDGNVKVWNVATCECVMTKTQNSTFCFVLSSESLAERHDPCVTSSPVQYSMPSPFRMRRNVIFRASLERQSCRATRAAVTVCGSKEPQSYDGALERQQFVLRTCKRALS